MTARMDRDGAGILSTQIRLLVRIFSSCIPLLLLLCVCLIAVTSTGIMIIPELHFRASFGVRGSS